MACDNAEIAVSVVANHDPSTASFSLARCDRRCIRASVAPDRALHVVPQLLVGFVGHGVPGEGLIWREVKPS